MITHIDGERVHRHGIRPSMFLKFLLTCRLPARVAPPVSKAVPRGRIMNAITSIAALLTDAAEELQQANKIMTEVWEC